MRVATTIDEARAVVRAARMQGRVVAFVPTMGALHEGHLSLMRLARKKAGSRAFVVVSIFVNPTQFGPTEDLDAYPRDLAADSAAAESAGAELIFAPTVREMYPEGFATKVRVEHLTEPLCGRTRPGHFDGVALVVTKLLNIVAPDLSVFGRKDAQQAVVIRRLARDLNLPGEIVLGETIREPDGLAKSSRNAYLSPPERAAAVAISRGLFAAERAWNAGERDADRLTGLVLSEIEREPLLAPEYVDLVNQETLEPWSAVGAGSDPATDDALLAAAVRVGKARLIDNVWLHGKRGGDV
ncbi:MAG: pantoate--beta-alanine ligase [Gemmatimonadetes bacterium]|nr:pantoate--beta-alanine ligase [Gemmatimonadota bacterium]